MTIFLGGNEPDTYKLGSNDVDKIYQGSDLVWEPGGGGITWDLTNAAYANKSKSLNGQSVAVRVVEFKPDGTKMYCGNAGQTFYQYSLSTAWDVSTATYDSKSIIITEDSPFYSIRFNPDGTKMYGQGISNDKVFQYSLSTAWDISTATYDTKSLSVGTQSGVGFGLFFKYDGAKLYISDYTNGTCYQYGLTTPWDVSTGSYDNKSFDYTTQAVNSSETFIDNTGKTVFMVSVNTDTVYQYTLDTAWDISSASYDSLSFSVGTQAGGPYSMYVREDGVGFYIADNNTNTIYQYDL